MSRGTVLEGQRKSGEGSSSKMHRTAEGVAQEGTGQQRTGLRRAQGSREVFHTHFRKLINEVLLLHDLEL